MLRGVIGRPAKRLLASMTHNAELTGRGLDTKQ